jgi:hypothetical protein
MQDELLLLLFVGARHVPSPIHHSFLSWEELIEIFDTLCILVQQLGFTWNRLSSFDQVQNCDRSPISSEDIIKMSRSRRIERIHDAN